MITKQMRNIVSVPSWLNWELNIPFPAALCISWLVSSGLWIAWDFFVAQEGLILGCFKSGVWRLPDWPDQVGLCLGLQRYVVQKQMNWIDIGHCLTMNYSFVSYLQDEHTVSNIAAWSSQYSVMMYLRPRPHPLPLIPLTALRLNRRPQRIKPVSNDDVQWWRMLVVCPRFLHLGQFCRILQCSCCSIFFFTCLLFLSPSLKVLPGPLALSPPCQTDEPNLDEKIAGLADNVRRS